MTLHRVKAKRGNSQLNAEVAEAREQGIELNAERRAQLHADREPSPAAIRRAMG